MLFHTLVFLLFVGFSLLWFLKQGILIVLVSNLIDVEV